MNDLKITVMYSCKRCGIHRAEVKVKAREAEDVLTWMDAVTKELGADHYNRSPNCMTEKLSDVMIPVSGADRVGGATVQ